MVAARAHVIWVGPNWPSHDPHGGKGLKARARDLAPPNNPTKFFFLFYLD